MTSRPQPADKLPEEIQPIIAMFGFLNRWNDTVGTQLEDEPAAFASVMLEGSGWEVGKHGT